MTFGDGKLVRIKPKSILYDETRKDVIGKQVGEKIGVNSNKGFKIKVHWDDSPSADDTLFSTKDLQIVPLKDSRIRDRVDSRIRDRVESRNGVHNEGTNVRVDSRNGVHNEGTNVRQRKVAAQKEAINKDAAAYKARVDKTMIFHACCACTYECGLEGLVLKEKFQDLIDKSALPTLYARMIAPCSDDTCLPSDRNYAIAAREELLEDGTMKNCSYLCKKCQTELRKVHASGALPCPKNALVNGHFKGSCPEELKKLNLTELSLISLINVVTKVSLLGNLNYGSKGTMFSIINDISVLLPSLPQRPTIEDYAFIRAHGSSESSLKHRYSPWKVLQALKWLENNNPLYCGKISIPEGENEMWTDPQLDQPIDVIEIPEESSVQVDESDVAAGSDGHAANPGATPSDNTDVLLMPASDTADIIDQVRTILTEGNCQIPPVLNRLSGETVSMQSTEFFIEKAFPHLYPYGRGGPGSENIEYNASYIKLVLGLGIGREFQQFPTFIFYSYRWIMHRAVGSIGWLTERNANPDDDSPNLTVEKATAFLQYAQNKAPVDAQLISTAEIMCMKNRAIPFANCAPGTELFFMGEKKKLMSMASSPVTTSKGRWTHFVTESMNDLYSPELYDNVITSANPTATEHGIHHSATLEERMLQSDKLTWSERAAVLRDHPCMAARMHALQLDALFETIIKGKSEPFGTVLDFWIRVEFQNKGTAHAHMLINTLRDLADKNAVGDLDVDDPEVIARLLELCQRSCTARLQPRDPTDKSDLSEDVAEHAHQIELEKDYKYNVRRKELFKDDAVCHPCRQRFRSDVDYSFDPVTGDIPDLYVKKQFRRLQLHNNMHICRGSCFKYCTPGTYICRYCFPREPLENNAVLCVLISDRDSRKRMRHKVHPPRSNGHLNNCPANPALYCASRGNMDVQVLTNSGGCVEYTCKYCGKADTAESTVLQNTISRELSNHVLRLPPHEQPTIGKKIRAVINAIVQGQQIGAVHACYILMKQKLVHSSRKVENVSPLIRKDIDSQPMIINEQLLEEMDDDDSALSNSPRCTFGRRDAYHALLKAQKLKYDDANFDFFSFLTSYSVETLSPTKKTPKSATDIPQLTMDDDGLIENAATCYINRVVYRARKNHAVLKLTPHIPAMEDTERSAYSVLLLHSDWGMEGESGLLGNCDSAIERLKQIYDTLPEYVKRNLGKKVVSEAHLDNTGEPAEAPSPVTEDDFDNHADGFEDDEIEKDSPNYVPAELMEGADDVALKTNNWMTHTDISKVAYLSNFIHNMKVKSQAAAQVSKSLTTQEVLLRADDASLHFPIHNVDNERDILEGLIASCNVRQADVVKCATPYLDGTKNEQMIMVLSGEGGTGKSHVINILTSITQLCHGRQQGRFGCVCKAAPTGGSAYNIGGFTWQSATGKCNFKKFNMTSKLTAGIVNRLRRDFKGCRFFILDEISMLSLEDINEISCRLQVAMDSTKPFGGLHVLLAGDYYQMQSINGRAVYTATENWTEYAQRTFKEAVAGRQMFTTHLTHFKMLTENVRARTTTGEPSPFATAVSQIRIGETSGTSLETINSRVLNGTEHAIRVAHPQALWIASTHKKIAVINATHAAKLTAAGNPLVRLIANHVGKNASIPTPDAKMRYKLYGVKGDPKGSIKNQPLSYIDLQIGSRVRLTKNLTVQNGLFTGTMGTIHGFVYRGKGPDIDNLMPSEFASLEYSERELPILLVRMDGVDDSVDPSKSTFPHSCSQDTTRLIPICAEPSTLSIRNAYHRVMYPLLLAHARTGHSVQGMTAHHGAVIAPGSRFFAGDYVAISRGKCLSQIWLLGALLAKHVTSHPQSRVTIEKEYARLVSLFPFSIDDR